MLRYFKKQMIKAQLISGQAGEYVDGNWAPEHATPVDIKIIAPQPIAANDTVNLEDGEHVRDFLKTYTTKKVMTREDSENADVIVTGGKFYKAYQVDNRKHLGNFYKIIMRKEDPGIWINGTFADAAERIAAADLEVADIGKFYRQLDDKTVWMLLSESPNPTWELIG